MAHEPPELAEIDLAKKRPFILCGDQRAYGCWSTRPSPEGLAQCRIGQRTFSVCGLAFKDLRRPDAHLNTASAHLMPKQSSSCQLLLVLRKARPSQDEGGQVARQVAAEEEETKETKTAGHTNSSRQRFCAEQEAQAEEVQEAQHEEEKGEQIRKQRRRQTRGKQQRLGSQGT